MIYQQWIYSAMINPRIALYKHRLLFIIRGHQWAVRVHKISADWVVAKISMLMRDGVRNPSSPKGGFEQFSGKIASHTYKFILPSHFSEKKFKLPPLGVE